jgi:hypothetical protein
VVAGWIAAVAACGGGGGSPNPVLGTLSFTTNQSVALNGTLTATDPGNSAVTFTRTSEPKSGTATVAAGGQFTYTPNPGFFGNDSFGVRASDAAGNITAGTVNVTQDRAPTATNTILRADGAALAAVKVLQNASDPDNDPLTVTIPDQPPAGLGLVSVNSDGSLAISGLSAFKGVTHFTYQVTDPAGQTAKASAAVFVGTDPFRASFIGDAPANGSNEVYLTDFAADPVVMTAATKGNLHLKGYAISDNGATIAYRTEDASNSANTSLSFVKTRRPPRRRPLRFPAAPCR